MFKNSNQNKLSNLRKYLLKLQNETKGFVTGVFCASFITIASCISGELTVFVLMIIWSVLLPLIMLVFQCLGVVLAKYLVPSSKLISYKGSYQDLVMKLFDDGFQYCSKVDNYYQFKSNLLFLTRDVLLVSKEEEGYLIFGNHKIIDMLTKDFASEDLKIIPVSNHSNIKQQDSWNKTAKRTIKKKFYGQKG